MVYGAAQHGSGGGDGRAAGSLGLHFELSKMFLDVRRQPGHQRPGRRAVLEARVRPKVRQHLQQVGFSAAEEAAYPHRVLPGRGVQVAEVAVQDPVECVGELAATHEGLQFGSKLALLVGAVARDSRLTVVGQLFGARVAFHQLEYPRRTHGHLSSVIGWAK